MVCVCACSYLFRLLSRYDCLCVFQCAQGNRVRDRDRSGGSHGTTRFLLCSTSFKFLNEKLKFFVFTNEMKTKISSVSSTWRQFNVQCKKLQNCDDLSLFWFTVAVVIAIAAAAVVIAAAGVFLLCQNKEGWFSIGTPLANGVLNALNNGEILHRARKKKSYYNNNNAKTRQWFGSKRGSNNIWQYHLYIIN